MNTMRFVRIGAILLFLGILSVGPAAAATVGDFTRGGLTDFSSFDKTAAITAWTDSSKDKAFLITDISGSPTTGIGKYIEDQKQNTIQWDPDFMKRTLRYAHYVPSCRVR